MMPPLFAQRLRQQRLDHRLTAHIEASGACVEFAQHPLGQVDINTSHGRTTVNLFVK